MKAGIVLAVVFLLLPGPARSAPLVADVSDHLVAITTGFSGTDILIFGALGEPGDVVVAVRGPSGPVALHRKEPVLGIWLNVATMTFPKAPSFYALAATAPIEAIVGEGERTRLRIGLDRLGLEPKARVSDNLKREWQSALIRAKVRAGLYKNEVTPVTLLGGQLFRTTFSLPTNVPVGTYFVDAFVFKNGIAVSAQTIPLIVSKVGFEAELFDFAQQQGPLYGLAAIALALFAGWLAHLAFRKH